MSPDPTVWGPESTSHLPPNSLYNSILFVQLGPPQVSFPSIVAKHFNDKRLTRRDFATMRGSMTALEKALDKSMKGERTISQDLDREGGLDF